jgi:hypothetical protein
LSAHSITLFLHASAILSQPEQLRQRDNPKKEVQPIEIYVDLDTAKFYKMFVDQLSAPTPQSAAH